MVAVMAGGSNTSQALVEALVLVVVVGVGALQHA
jgi:hypothetical protein